MQKQQVFENFQFTEECTEYKDTIFKNSNFAKGNLGSYEFTDCTFFSCDLSMTRFDNAVFTRVKFVNCKLLGVDFGKCSKFIFSVSFDDCILNYCFFHKNNLKKTLFKKCVIKEASFAEAELNTAIFAECDLTATTFERCNLTECDFRTAQNYNILPSENKIRNAMFSYPGVLGLLNHYHIIIE